MGDRLVAKSLDDRAGVVVLIETLRAIKSTPNDLYFVFTTQEEVGTRGAGAAAFGIDPDIGIASRCDAHRRYSQFIENGHGTWQGTVCEIPRCGHDLRSARCGLDDQSGRESKDPLST